MPKKNIRKIRQKTKRIWGLIALISGIGLGIGLVLAGLYDNIVYFYSPTELLAQAHKDDITKRTIRIGGVVVRNSISNIYESEGGTSSGQNYSTKFDLTDDKSIITVYYQGKLPIMFREGQGIVAEGKMQKTNLMIAKRLLTKHDENYRPPAGEKPKALELAQNNTN